MRSERSRIDRSTRARAALTALLLAAAAGCTETDSTIGAAEPAIPGLVGEYFSSIDFNDAAGTFVDPNIELPAPAMDALFTARGIEPRGVSVHWTGQIRFAYPENYTLFLATSGRVRLWVAEVLIIDRWDAHPTVEEYMGTAPSDDAGWRNMSIEFDQAEGPLSATFLYASASQPKTVVPRAALRHLP